MQANIKGLGQSKLFQSLVTKLFLLEWDNIELNTNAKMPDASYIMAEEKQKSVYICQIFIGFRNPYITLLACCFQLIHAGPYLTDNGSHLLPFYES